MGKTISCKRCQSQMIAYLNRELRPSMRERMANHLDTCPTCYARFLQESQLASELQQEIPLVGRGQTPGFDQVWSAFRRDRHGSSTRSSFSESIRYGWAVLAVAVMLVIPMTMGAQQVTLASAPTQPSPMQIAQQSTPSGTPLDSEEDIPAPTLLQTPEAQPALVARPLPDVITTP
ncbi:MAG: zf-HC2 domain-containing protein [Anaerolineae bacterium]|nr:zf-HC2 domain-containing protein [Anaerolineae bacterium]